MSHFLNKCKHGVVVSQCRCPGPKATHIVPCPLDHASWPDVTVVDEAPTEIAQPPSAVPTLEDAGAHKERKLIVEFLRAKARELSPVKPGGSLALVQAAILDAATWIEQGDHRA